MRSYVHLPDDAELGRPDHKRHADGGRPVREQRREVGLPRRLEAVS